MSYSIFKVLIETSKGIEFRNFFEFGQWSVIERELKKIRSKYRKIAKSQDLMKLNLAWNEDFFHVYTNKTAPVDFDKVPSQAVEEALINKCRYYFCGKCEYEVVVQGWPNEEHEKKIDVFDQLKANWPTFVMLVFNEIKMKRII